MVLIDWASAYWSKQRYARVVTDIEPAPRPEDERRCHRSILRELLAQRGAEVS